MRESGLFDYQQENAAVAFFRRGLFGIEEDPAQFRELSSERRSPHYFDIRKGVSSFRMRKMVANLAGNLVKYQQSADEKPYKYYSHFVGVPEAMTVFTTTLADRERTSQLQIRANKQKNRGNRSPILGEYTPGDRVALFEDAVTSGQSTIDEIDTVHAAGLVVEDVFVIVDRQEGGVDAIREHTGVDVIAGLAVANMVQFLRAEGEITQTQYDNVAEYLTQYGDDNARRTLGIV